MGVTERAVSRAEQQFPLLALFATSVAHGVLTRTIGKAQLTSPKWIPIDETHIDETQLTKLDV